MVAFAFEFAGESVVGWGFLCGAILGLVLTVVGFRALRRKNRPWKIEYEADRWELERADRNLHPVRARYKRIAKRVLVCMPSLAAAVVLFYFPVATHVVHPGSHHLRYYRVPIPWNVAILTPPVLQPAHGFVWALASNPTKGGFGVIQFWDRAKMSSAMEFISINPDADPILFNTWFSGSRTPLADQKYRREFQLSGVELICWQYQYSHIAGGWWSIDCRTPAGVRRLNLHASFFGREDDIPVFYKIIEGITPVE